MQEKAPTHYLMGKKLAEHKLSPTLPGMKESMMNRVRELAETLDNAESIEIEYLDEKEVVSQIILLAKDEGISVSDLDNKMEAEEDDDGNLICLDILVKPDIARQRGCEGIRYKYMAKGDQGEAGYCKIASIIRFESGDPSKTKLLCMYLDRQGKWVKPPKS